MKRIIIGLILMLFVFSCGNSNVGKILRNEKVKTTDEFLVKKRAPLSMPPEYETLPEPDTLKILKKENKKDFKDIIKIPKEQNTTTSSKNNSVEQEIINQIKK